MHKVAALFVDPRGCYIGLPHVDPWDEARDARLYAGPLPVVAHPPCQLWVNLAALNFKRWGGEHNRPGNDGGCFAAALAAVRRCGGVLEHPAFTNAWAAHGLARPVASGWALADVGAAAGPGWVCEVWQSAYGHRARKRTWLYACGPRPPELDWRRLAGTAQVGSTGSSRPSGSGRRSPLHQRSVTRCWTSPCVLHSPGPEWFRVVGPWFLPSKDIQGPTFLSGSSHRGALHVPARWHPGRSERVPVAHPLVLPCLPARARRRHLQGHPAVPAHLPLEVRIARRLALARVGRWQGAQHHRGEAQRRGVRRPLLRSRVGRVRRWRRPLRHQHAHEPRSCREGNHHEHHGRGGEDEGNVLRGEAQEGRLGLGSRRQGLGHSPASTVCAIIVKPRTGVSMSTPPQPPAIPRKTIEESEPLKAYHTLMLPFYEQLRDALGEVRFKDNHGAVVTEPTAFTAGASGGLTGAFVPCTFQPLAVWFRAEAIDAAKRPTGVCIGGSAYWNTAPRSGEQGFTVTTAPGLTNGTTYLMTFIALPG